MQVNTDTRAPDVGTVVGELDTPTPMVDLDRLERNLRRWQDEATVGGAKFRPHIKTHKIPEIALMQVELGAVGIATAKVSEAEVFAAAGIEDVVIAYPVVGRQKWERMAQMVEAGTRLAVNLDSPEAAHGMSEVAGERGVRFGVQIEVDTGFHRVGFPLEDVDGIERLGRLVEELPGIELEGITTHRGVFFEGADSMSPEEAGREEGEVLVDLAERLRERGVEVKEVTAGGTITGRAVAKVPGVTEVRAGTYVFNDLMQIGFGTAGWDDLALSVLCTVTSRYGERATIDGGSKTFSGDRGVVGGAAGAMRGIVKAVDRDVYLQRLTEEHGMVDEDAGSLQIGERLAWYPFHACTCANLSDQLVGVRDGKVETVWALAARGKRE